MRGLFHQRAQRDLLRPELNQDQQNQAPQKATGGKKRRLPSLKGLMSVFVLAALANEASHHHHPQNPHGNRRERIEEIRQRLSEAEANRGTRILNAGGHPPEPRPTQAQFALDTAGRRRITGSDIRNG